MTLILRSEKGIALTYEEMDNNLIYLENFVKALFPIGSIYTNASDSTNPSELLGFGTWEKFAEGRFLIGDGTGNDGSTSNTFTAEDQGGLYDHQHVTGVGAAGGTGAGGMRTAAGDDSNPDWPYGTTNVDAGTKDNEVNTTTGGTNSFYNTSFAEDVDGQTYDSALPPYVTVYMWKRIL